MKELQSTSLLAGGNAPYLEAMYEAYLHDPNAVDARWRTYFDTLPRSNGGGQPDIPHSEVRQHFYDLAKRNGNGHALARAATGMPDAAAREQQAKQIRVLQLINVYRTRGHQLAKIDPLERNKEAPDIPELELRYHGVLTEADFDSVFHTGSLYGPDHATLSQILDIMQRTYCASVGVEYMHITETVEKRWIQQRIEGVQGKPELPAETRKWLLQRLTAAEGLERYLHSKYVGQKRFSLEGGESLIPLMNELIDRAGTHGAREVVIGMAHRGRLNVLVNIVGKTPGELFQEFEGKHSQELASGDVKYHMGFSSDVQTSGGHLHMTLAFNPSHLEIVAPVVEGSVRARQVRHGDKEGNTVLPIVIHGDAAFAGQGVVMENFNMSQSRGYSTKGTVHIVVNNQIGFTTSNQEDQRSTYYCTDVAKMVNAPIFHVNGDDPEAVLFVTQMALDYRMEYNKDVVIDLVCYRRHGHNEADEPSATQPMMYKIIKQLQTTRELYAAKLESEGVIDADEATAMSQRIRDELDAGQGIAPNVIDNPEFKLEFTVDWSPYFGHQWNDHYDTHVSIAKLRELWQHLEHLPDGFELHPRVSKIMDDRRKMVAGALPLDWGFAEIMAYATLLDDGFSVRLSGQDCGRGTFFHRHAVLHNQLESQAWVPLRNVPASEEAEFLVIDSVLSEEAVLGFEYGYATAEPNALVIWEAQFGDFANGAQVVIDQFISSGEAKWGRFCGLVMLLPHGYEGQGPEHSSARLERYLQLCAEHNLQVCVPTTPAQAFHMLRRQMVRPYRKPLVVMTPKSLLRHKLATSTLEDLTEGTFQAVIPEIDDLHRNEVRRIVMCSGKVYYDLLERRRREEIRDVAIVRLEQLYPFPENELKEAIERYETIDDYCWCQEEPMNQGSWYSSNHHMRRCIGDLPLRYAGRPHSASPAVGYGKLHSQQQNALVESALGIDSN
ncbi:MAG: 2-oxoglutarate dehydrogenase E1 component [Gammaproteobacteria bacterium]|nr:2-oxoglutarate dehydrogenase E1 component [Gammaproteobacteria bacterium]